MVLLFGFRVDVEFDAHVYTLTPEEDPDKKLKFKSAQGGLQLLETQYAVGLSENVTQYLSRFDSVPGFLSAICLQNVRNGM